MLSGFIYALQMLSRIQIGHPVFDERRYGRSTAFFPVVGVIIGGILFLVLAVTAGHFPPVVKGAFLLAAGVVISGGMHADGLMDSMDALFSGRSREKKLEILRDVHVGAFGVVAGLTVFIVKFALLAGLCATSRIGWVFVYPTVARWAMVYVIRFFPYLWKEGLGRAVADYTGNFEFGLATFFLALVTGIVWSWPGFPVLVVLTVLIHLWGSRVVRAIGGVSGDIYGATCELAEVAGLICLYIVPSSF